MDNTDLAILIVIMLLPTSMAFLIARNLWVWKNAEKINGKIIGYKFSGISKWLIIRGYTSRFWPVIEYEEEGKTKTVVVKHLDFLVPEGRQIKIRLYQNKHADLYNFPYVVVLFFPFILLYAILLPQSINDIFHEVFAYAFLIMSFMVAIFEAIYEIKCLGKGYRYWSNYNYTQKPENFSSFTPEQIKDIEQKDLISYEDARIHCYNSWKKSLIWLVPLWTIAAIWIGYEIYSRFIAN